MAIKVKAVERKLKFTKNENDPGVYRYVLGAELYTALNQKKVIRQPRNHHDTWKATFEEGRDSLVYGDSTMALPGKKHPWWALAEVTGINVGVQLFDRYVTREDFAQTTLRTIRQNFERGMVWDNDSPTCAI